MARKEKMDWTPTISFKPPSDLRNSYEAPYPITSYPNHILGNQPLTWEPLGNPQHPNWNKEIMCLGAFNLSFTSKMCEGKLRVDWRNWSALQWLEFASIPYCSLDACWEKETYSPVAGTEQSLQWKLLGNMGKGCLISEECGCWCLTLAWPYLTSMKAWKNRGLAHEWLEGWTFRLARGLISNGPTKYPRKYSSWGVCLSRRSRQKAPVWGDIQG